MSAEPSVDLGPIEDAYPLTPLQEGMLFDTLRSPGTGVYVQQLSCRIEGPLDAAVFDRAWRTIAARHATLRTAFEWEEVERPLQVVFRSAGVPFLIEDWRALPDETRHRLWRRRLREDRTRDFVLDRAPLQRVTLVRLGEREHRLVWSHHHMLLDGWSVALLMEELLAAYQAHAAGRSPSLAATTPYRRYIAWLEGRRGESVERFWRRKLGDFRVPSRLADRNGSAAAAETGSEAREHHLRLSAGESAELRAFARRQGLTLNSIVQACWGVLIGRYANTRDVVFGSMVSGRPASLPNVDRMIGLFVNTLPVRLRLPRRRSLLAWLREVQHEQHELLDYEHTPLVEAHGWSGMDRGDPLFDTILTFDNYQSGSRPPATGDGLRFGEILFSERTAYPLTVDVLPGERMIVQLLWETARFERTAILRLAGHLRNLLLGVVTGDPERPVASLRLLGRAEEHQLRVEWNDTAAALPLDRTVNDRLDEHAGRCPDAVAVVDGDRAVSYGALRCRRDRLAAELAGDDREPVVAVLAERGDDFLVALLAILAAGAVYLPLDPAYPEDRLAQVLETARPRLLLTGAALAARARTLAGVGGPRILDLAVLRGPGPAAPPRRPVAPSALAYVLYTSGSTGRPKGAMVTHGGMTNHLLAKVRDLRLGAEDRLAQNAPQGFDISVWQFLAPLMVGGTVEVVDTETAREPERLFAHAERSRCTVLETVPSLLRVLLASLEESAIPGGPALRCLLSTGEALAPEVRDAWLRARPGVELVNAYGPTECSDDVTHGRLAPGGPGDHRPVPIGEPVVNTALHILDADGAPAPLGVTGELHVGGAGVGRGYLDDPGRTAPVFVPDPYAGDGAGSRLYRTGDRARWRPEGSLEYLGRIDRQAKIRGVRIELGEIEAVLTRHPAVADGVVRLWGDASGDARLVAYAVPSDGALDADEVLGSLRRVLPEAVVPQALVSLDAMPLTSNGKIDRGALPEPRWEGGDEEADRSLGGPTEEIVAGIWSRVLGVARVGPRDGFFALGGHSLLATRIVARVREVFAVEVSLRDLFDAPTVRAFARRIERELRGGRRSRPEIRPAPRDEPLPLSFGQERLWFITQLEPESAAYNIPRIVRLTGSLDLAALAGALGELTRRHEVLRARIAAEDGEPRQVFAPPAPAALPVVDLSRLSPEHREAVVRRRTASESRRPFDLAAEPPFRATVFRLAQDDHAGAFTVHHIASDGWSMGLLISEVVTLYAAFAAARPSPLPELPVQYADFAVWQRNWLRGEALEAELDYWRRLLAGSPSTLDLPTDRPRPPVRGSRGALLSFPLPDGLAARLSALARSRSLTPYMVLVAGFQALLSRWAHQERFNLGTLTAGRHHPGTEELIGFFVNTLVLPADLSGRPVFHRLLDRAREVVLGVHAHQDLPFEKLVEELDPRRSLSHTPLFQVMFQLLVEPRPRADVEGLGMRAVEADTSTAPFDLLLTLSQAGERMRGSFRYATDLFDRTTVRRLADRYVALLEAAAGDPERPLEDLPPLGAAERHQAVVEWASPAGPAPPVATLTRLFLAQAARAPDAVAVVRGGERLSYGALAARGARLARRLRTLGAGRGDLVAVAARREPEMVTGLLGVLLSGAAYVPLDLGYPDERLAAVLEDSGARLALVSRGLETRFDRLGVTPVPLASGEDDGAGEREPPLPSVDPGDLAYLIYTSGSTGRPKGVGIEHRSATAFLTWAGDVFGGGDLDRVLASTAICFDLSVFEIFAPLVHGGCTVLVDRVLDLADAPGWGGVRLVNTVPSAMSELLALAGPPAAVRTVALAGEPLLRDLADRLYRAAPESRLLNLYGPSEDTTYSTVAVVPRDGAAAPTIGRPIAGTRAYLVGPRFRPVAHGVVGELLLGGQGLARGYPGRPARTAEAFVPDPFGPPGSRLYRTGDLCRFDRRGELLFLGRRDRQVKLRGYRIELQEIETVLARHPSVAQAVVELRRRAPAAGDRLLVAYLTPAGSGAPDLGALEELVGRSLPAYMRPARWVVLDAFPLLPSGKIDRRALPAPSAAEEADAGEAGAPGELGNDPVQELVATVWSRILGVERLGPASDFFALGGHSLLAVRLIARLREVFGVDVPLRRVFETPTVAGLSAAVSDALRAGRRSSLEPLAPVPRGASAPLSFAQQRLWLLDRLNPVSTAYSIPAFFRIGGAIGLAPLARALAEVVRRHEILRTTFRETGGEVLQVIGPPPEPHLPLVDLSGLAARVRDREAVRLGREEAARPFDLAAGPLFRTTVLRLANDDHAALAIMHHVVSDGWSIRLLAREVSVLYAAFRQGRPSPLPELPVQYADYAIWQRETLAGEALDEGLGYWRERLSPIADAPVELPTDRPRPALQSFAGASRGFAVPAPVGQALAALGVEARATSFMVLSAALHALLGRYSSRRWIALGTPSAGRGQPGVESLIGCFVNTLVLAVEVGDDPSFRELVERVREATLEAHAYQDVPFERLVEELEPRRDLSRSPLFQTLFTMQDATVGERSEVRGGLDLQPLGVAARAAKFDLSFTMAGGGGSLRGAIVYASALFDPSTVARMAGHYVKLLAAAAADPGRRLSELSLLAPAERHQALFEWPDGGVPRRECPWLAGRVRAVAEETPDRVAVVDGGRHLSYGALWRRSRTLADRLRALGVGPGGRVGVHASRSAEGLTAMLGVAASGGAWVALDPDDPPERLEHVARDAGPAVLVAAGEPGFDTGGVPVVDLSAIGAETPAGGALSPPPGEAAAYVLYTSGSTGVPKGVEVSHRALAGYLDWAAEAYRTDPECGTAPRSLVHTSSSFDFTVTPLWLPLLLGGTTEILPAEAGPDDLARRLRRTPRFSLLKLTPSHLDLLADEIRHRGLDLGAAADLLVVGGEALLPRQVALARRGTGARIVNEYGPTEATVGCIVHPVEAAVDSAGAVPIGRPIPGCRVLVADEHLRPCPPGVAGELLLAGVGLARGYTGRARATAERFVPEPEGPAPGGRAYRTGDLARWLHDGSLVFLGRIDEQIKVRGVRVEPGEVAAILASHPDVGETVVTADPPGAVSATASIAFFTSAEEPDPAALRRHLAERLPAGMIPGRFVRLDRLPLTASGKLDRRALAELAGAPEDRAGRRVRRPRSLTEMRLVEIWEELLGTAEVSIDDDFFALGGHSLLAVRMMARVRDRLGADLPLDTVFAAPTLEALALRVAAGVATDGGESRIAVRLGGTMEEPVGDTPLFCVHPVGGTVFCYAELARSLAPSVPLVGLQAPLGPDEPERPESVEEIAGRYLPVVREASGGRPYRLAGWSMGGLVAFEMARALAAEGEEVELLALFDTPAPRRLRRLRQPDRRERILRFAGDLGGLGARNPVLDADTVSGDEPLEDLFRRVRDAGLVPPGLRFEEVVGLYRVFESNLLAAGRYRPRPYAGSLELFVSEERAADASRPDSGWGRLAKGGVRVHQVPGDHYSILTAPGVDVLAERLRGLLHGTRRDTDER